jgi:Ca2+-binding RTX toxin-like protein
MKRWTIAMFNALMVVAAGTANATTVTLSANDVVKIGMRTDTNVPAYCLVVSANNDVITNLTGNSSGLGADYVFDLSTGAEELVVLTASEGTFNCSTSGGTVSMTTLLYNGHPLDVNGGSGADRIKGGTGLGILRGGDGDDRITVRHDGSTAGAEGEAGSDVVCSDGVDTIKIYGFAFSGTDDNTADCLERQNPGASPSNPAAFNCGGGTDEYVDITGYSEQNCDTQRDFCGQVALQACF